MCTWAEKKETKKKKKKKIKKKKERGRWGEGVSTFIEDIAQQPGFSHTHKNVHPKKQQQQQTNNKKTHTKTTENIHTKHPPTNPHKNSLTKQKMATSYLIWRRQPAM